MDFKVIFEDTFIEDLGAIVRKIATQNPTAALKLGEQIIRTAESLSFFPERYPRMRQRPHIRRLIVHKNFKVFYRIQYQHRIVEILRCWDCRRGTDPVL